MLNYLAKCAPPVHTLRTFAVMNNPMYPSSTQSYSHMPEALKYSALGCNIYISEGRNKQLITRLQAEASATPDVVLAHIFVDEPYHRTGFTLVSSQPDKLATAVVRLSRTALRLIDLRLHAAAHPRLGVVDHICFHPLGCLTAPSPSPCSNRTTLATTPSTRTCNPTITTATEVAAANSTSTAACQSGRPSSPRRRTALRTAEWHWSAPVKGGEEGLMEASVSCAREVARQLAEGALGEVKGVGGHVYEGAAGAAPAIPVYLYGNAHDSGRRLADVRRQLGYFRSSPGGMWRGALQHPQSLTSHPKPPSVNTQSPAPGSRSSSPSPSGPSGDANCLQLAPDMGPSDAPPASGVVTMGAVPWVTNYNVPLVGIDLSEAKWLARAVSERGGGLPGVEAMALRHADSSIEVACNLLDAFSATGPAALQTEIERLAVTRGLAAHSVQCGYVTNQTPEQLMRLAAEVVATEAADKGMEAELGGQGLRESCN